MICRANPYNGTDPYIFVNYCPGDQSVVFPILEQMAKDSYRVWFEDGTLTGNDLIEDIESHLEDCKLVVVFVSDSFSMSHICRSVIVYAMKCGKKIIPIQIDNANLPMGLRMQLDHLHCTNLAQFPSVRAMLDKIYAAEEGRICKAPAGSIVLKDPASTAQESDHPDKKTGILEGLNTFRLTYTGQKETTPPVKDDIPEQQTSAVSAEDPHHSGEKIIPESHDNTDDINTVFIPTKREGIGIDNDVTVRVSSRSAALLLHPAGQCAHIIKKPQTKIGRSSIKCDVVISGNDSVSKLHAEIRQYNQKYFLLDCNSANGTFLNGQALDAGAQAQLDNPSIFHLNDEMLILFYGPAAQKLISAGSVSLLVNESRTAIRLIDSNVLPLNRNSKWPDGTLSDSKIHREKHALLVQQKNGIFLVDETPERSNGTHLNGRRLNRSEVCLLSSGDRIQLGDTVLEFVTITI